MRVENLREIFHEGNIDIDASVRVGTVEEPEKTVNAYIRFKRETGDLKIETFTGPIHFREDIRWPRMGLYPDLAQYEIDQKFRVLNSYSHIKSSLNYIKRYSFNPDVKYKEQKTSFLQPSFGANLLYVLELMPQLRQLYAQWFRQYGLRLVLDTASQSLKIQKEKGDDEVFQLPYSSVADTLQRIIFYKTAVASNQNSVLLFEEPEAHAYPPYIVEFTQEVIKSQTNQFFIVTHSPLIVNDFLENAIDDLAIFMVDFKDGQTVAKPLSRDEIRDVYKYGVDLFFNNEAYLA